MKVKKYLLLQSSTGRTSPRRLCAPPSDYYSYINSNEWKNKHKIWLKQSHYRCSMFLWVKIGKYSPKKYGKYNIHHTGVGYRHLGQEKLWKDVLPLCPLAHWIIHGGNMKAKAPWRPNLLQKFLHLWCSLPLLFKRLVLVFLVWAVTSSFSVVLGAIVSAIIFCSLSF